MSATIQLTFYLIQISDKLPRFIGYLAQNPSGIQ
jgi:hypothetical protein